MLLVSKLGAGYFPLQLLTGQYALSINVYVNVHPMHNLTRLLPESRL